MKRDKWRKPASLRRSGGLTMRGCGKAIELVLGGIALLPNHAKVANDAKLSPIPRLNYNLRQTSRWSEMVEEVRSEIMHQSVEPTVSFL